METYSWTKFYPEHCDDSTINMMESEDVHISWDEMPDAQDFVDALANIEDTDKRLWLYYEFREAVTNLGEEYLSEYLDCEGIDEIFRKMLDDYDQPLSHDLVMNLIEYGMDEEDVPLVLGRYHGKYTGEEAENLFATYNVPNEYAIVIIQERIESLTRDQIEEIMNCIDENVYPAMMPFISRLSFEERMDLVDAFGIDMPSISKKDKNEPGKLFSAIAMTGAIVEGLKEGIKGEKGHKWDI